eukprot:COSAG05_NODE_1512_length_4670_cov_13.100416_1_plen_918_part_00
MSGLLKTSDDMHFRGFSIHAHALHPAAPRRRVSAHPCIHQPAWSRDLGPRDSSLGRQHRHESRQPRLRSSLLQGRRGPHGVKCVLTSRRALMEAATEEDVPPGPALAPESQPAGQDSRMRISFLRHSMGEMTPAERKLKLSQLSPEELVLFFCEPQVPPDWAPMESTTHFARVRVPYDSDPAVWEEVKKRVEASLPDFELVGVERVQNTALWRKFSDYTAQLSAEGIDPGERGLFHYAKDDVIRSIIEGKGFLPQIGGGEYGCGSYFAEHAAYSVAYGNGWLDSDIDAERKADETVTLLWAKVALGRCKDFGARCRSPRGDVAAAAAGVEPGLPDWGPPIGRAGEGTFKIPPPSHESVSGTEGDLLWAENPRLRDNGAEYGRQYITFETAQSYPELVLQLQRKQTTTEEFRNAEAEEAKGKEDREMDCGTMLYIAGHGKGVVCKGWSASRIPFAANVHSVRFDSGLQKLELRDLKWHVIGCTPSLAHRRKVADAQASPDRSRSSAAAAVTTSADSEFEPELWVTVGCGCNSDAGSHCKGLSANAVFSAETGAHVDEPLAPGTVVTCFPPIRENVRGPVGDKTKKGRALCIDPAGQKWVHEARTWHNQKKGYSRSYRMVSRLPRWYTMTNGIAPPLPAGWVTPKPMRVQQSARVHPGLMRQLQRALEGGGVVLLAQWELPSSCDDNAFTHIMAFEVQFGFPAAWVWFSDEMMTMDNVTFMDGRFSAVVTGVHRFVEAYETLCNEKRTDPAAWKYKVRVRALSGTGWSGWSESSKSMGVYSPPARSADTGTVESSPVFGIRANRGKRYVIGDHGYTPSGRYPSAIAVPAGTAVVPISQHQQPGADWWKVKVTDAATGEERSGFVPRAFIVEAKQDDSGAALSTTLSNICDAGSQEGSPSMDAQNEPTPELEPEPEPSGL